MGGRAERPVYLLIKEDGVELHHADHLWGKDTFETDDALRALYEPCGIIPNNPAGEHLVKTSITMVDKFATIGKGGLHAVMASKNLEAMVVVEGSSEVSVAHRLRLEQLVNEMHERVMGWRGREGLLERGMTALDPESAEVHRRNRQGLACPSCPRRTRSSFT
jgi:aldehyde:ferredoxin oxidoreductase